MASRAEHLEQARQNRAHAERLLADSGDDPTARQWAMTATFYAALHCLEAHLVNSPSPHRTHVERRAALADPRNRVPGDVYFAYGQLQQWSERARYDLQPFGKAQVRTALDEYLSLITALVGLDAT